MTGLSGSSLQVSRGFPVGCLTIEQVADETLKLAFGALPPPQARHGGVALGNPPLLLRMAAKQHQTDGDQKHEPLQDVYDREVFSGFAAPGLLTDPSAP